MSGGKGAKGGNLESLGNRALFDDGAKRRKPGGNWRKPEVLSPPRFDSLFQGGVEGEECFLRVVEHGAERRD